MIYDKNILLIHNFHRKVGGSDVIVNESYNAISEIFEYVDLLYFKSENIMTIKDKTKLFINQFYPVSYLSEIKLKLKKCKPHIVIVHEFYPLPSPWIFKIIKANTNAKIIYYCHDHRLTCPTAFPYLNNKICNRCFNGNAINCLWFNCKKNLSESLTYAMRHYFFYFRKYCLDYVDHIIVPSVYLKGHLISTKICSNTITVVPNFINFENNPKLYKGNRDRISFVGRFVTEKGSDYVIKLGLQTKLPIQIVGEISDKQYNECKNIQNIHIIGPVEHNLIDEYYKKSKIVIVPSVHNEVFGLVAIEAMKLGIPVIASNVGGLKELIIEGFNGFLFDPEKFDDFKKIVVSLWNDDDLCKKMGNNASSFANRYSKLRYQENITKIIYMVCNGDS